MDTSAATLRFLRMSPRKVRLVVDVVRGMEVDKAVAQLMFSPKSAARPVRKLIESAVANAVNNHDMQKDALYVATIKVDGGPTYKRYRPRAHGRAAMIRKRTSHINVVLKEREDLVKKTTKKAKSTKAEKKAPTKVEKVAVKPTQANESISSVAGGAHTSDTKPGATSAKGSAAQTPRKTQNK